MSAADTTIPTIDLAPFLRGDEAGKLAAARQIDEACRDTGFFTVVGHGVSEDLVSATRQQAVDFFAQPDEEKMRVQRPPQKISRGYFKLRDRSLSYSLGIAAPPDIQEAYAFGPEQVPAGLDPADPVTATMFARNIWPDGPEGFRKTLVTYYETMSGLAMNVMRVISTALGVREDYFFDKFDHQTSASRIIRYPALTEPPVEGQLRAGAHHDYGTITFVRGDDTPGGLQVKHRRGDWIDVHPVPNSFVCNLGDLMARWTNDRWVSTLHRVAVPPPDAAPSDRISLVFFQLPNHDALIRCIETCKGPNGEEKYPPVTVSDHYLGKVMKAAHSRVDANLKDAVTAD